METTVRALVTVPEAPYTVLVPLDAFFFLLF